MAKSKDKHVAICIAISITLATLTLPSLVQPFMTNLAPLQTISNGIELVQYLLNIQNDPDILIGIHGWEHRCPICGEGSHEFSCPYEKIDDSIIEYRITSAIQAFHNSGLTPDFWAFPGGSFDERSIAILRRYDFVPVTRKSEENAGEGVVCYSLSTLGKLPSQIVASEYTYMWRYETRAREEFVASFERAKALRPNLIMSHIQDLNTQTYAWFDIILNHVDVKIMELHDVTVDTVEETKRFVDFCRERNVPTIALLIIPTHHGIENPIHEAWAATYFAVYVTTFEFPTLFFLSWYMLVRRKKQVA